MDESERFNLNIVVPLQRAPFWTTLTTLLLFSAVAGALAFQWRSDLYKGVLRREAEEIRSVLLLQQTIAAAKHRDFTLEDASADLFTAILESSRLRGVLVARLFDSTGILRQAVPDTREQLKLDNDLLEMAHQHTSSSLARFYKKRDLSSIYGSSSVGDGPKESAPLAEVIVPIDDLKSGNVIGVAQYWMNGAIIEAEFTEIDRGLALEVGLIVLVGAGGIASISAWSFRRLSLANRRLHQQGEDLKYANCELEFAAKMSAIGAISAHLIHGLKSPLVGLEGFVTDGSGLNGKQYDGEAWREAAETTRRLRSIVNDVTAVLRSESITDDLEFGVGEIVDDVFHKLSAEALAANVKFVANADSNSICLDGRVAGLTRLVLTNLVSNAVEAAPKGTAVRLVITALDSELEFRVFNQGDEIPKVVREHLFHPVLSSKPGGSGIGLAISKQLVRHCGGRLELVSSSADGTTFFLSVPRSLSAREGISTTQDPALAL